MSEQRDEFSQFYCLVVEEDMRKKADSKVIDFHFVYFFNMPAMKRRIFLEINLIFLHRPARRSSYRYIGEHGTSNFHSELTKSTATVGYK